MNIRKGREAGNKASILLYRGMHTHVHVQAIIEHDLHALYMYAEYVCITCEGIHVHLCDHVLHDKDLKE